MFKKIFLLVVIFFYCFSSPFAQGIHLGIKIGSDIQKIDGASFTEKYAVGYHLGGFAELKLNNTFSIQPELYYSAVNLTVDTAKNNFSALYDIKNVNKLNFGYINVPILLNIYANKFLGIQVGPRFGVLSNSNLSIKANADNAIKSGDLSIVTGIQIKLLNVRVYGRYQVGLNDINDATSTEKWKTQTIHLGAAISLL